MQKPLDKDRLRFTMFQAREGDCVLVECLAAGRTWRMLVDGGRKVAIDSLVRYLAETGAGTAIDLVVATHIDSDHIAGLVRLLRVFPEIRIGEIWFNGLTHVRRAKDPAGGLVAFGAADAGKLTELIRERSLPWNAAFSGNPVLVPAPGAHVEKDLGGGRKVTLLSPDPQRLAALERDWSAWLIDAGIQRGTEAPDEKAHGDTTLIPFGSGTIDVEELAASGYDPDRAVPNGSSIAFLFEWRGRRFLFGADAHSEVIVAGLRGLIAPEQSRIAIDLVKVSHHGSKKNSSPDFFSVIRCENFAFSTDGRHDLPDRETIARILVSHRGRKNLIFNYENEASKDWSNGELKIAHDYAVTRPAAGKPWTSVDFCPVAD